MPADPKPVQELSAAERAIVIASLGAGRPGVYDIAFTLAFRSGCDVDRLRAAVEAFSTANLWTRRRYQRVGRRLGVIADGGHIPVESGATVLRTPLDVLGGPLVRFGLSAEPLAATVHLDLRIHHAIADGVSVALILDTLVDAYRTGTARALPFGSPSSAELPAPGTPDPDEDRFAAAVGALRTAPDHPGRVVFDVPDRPAGQFYGAAARALAGWAGTGAVAVSTPILGRRPAEMGSVGPYVRTVMLDFPQTAAAAADLGNAAVAALRQEAFGGEPTLRPARFPVVMVDRKGTSLLDRVLDAELDIVLLDDPARAERKYPLHVSAYAVRGTQTVTIEGDGFPDVELERLADSLRAELATAAGAPVAVRPAPVRSAHPQRSTLVPETAGGAR